MFEQFSWHLAVTAAAAFGAASPAPSYQAPMPQPAPAAYGWLPTATLRPLSAPDTCMDVTGGFGEDGAAIETYPCHGGANQQIAFDGTRVEVLGKCLDAEGGALEPGTRLILWPCHDGANQRWERVGDALRLVGTNLCAEAPAARSHRRSRWARQEAPDPELHLAVCSGTPEQQWLSG